MNTPAEVEALVHSGLPLARKLAAAMDRRTPPSVLYDELESAALEGLWRAAQAYDSGQGTTFKTFAAYAIRGRMLDLLRQYDRVSRTVRTRAKRLSEAKRRLTAELGRVPTQEELAGETGHSLVELDELDEERIVELSLDHVLMENGQGKQTVMLDTIVAAQAEEDDGADRFEELTRGLSERSKAILWLYYWEGFTMAAIGEQLGCSESRISQVVSDICERLRSQLTA